MPAYGVAATSARRTESTLSATTSRVPPGQGESSPTPATPARYTCPAPVSSTPPRSAPLACTARSRKRRSGDSGAGASPVHGEQHARKLEAHRDAVYIPPSSIKRPGWMDRRAIFLAFLSYARSRAVQRIFRLRHTNSSVIALAYFSWFLWFSTKDGWEARHGGMTGVWVWDDEPVFPLVFSRSCSSASQTGSRCPEFCPYQSSISR